MSAAVVLQDVGKTFASGVQALAPLSSTIKAGSFTSIVGPSGCGKSTLLRVIAGLSAPTTGRVERDAPPHSTSFVFQDATLMPWATVAANVALPLRLAGRPDAEITERVTEALARVGLDGFAGSFPHQLSGGMKMRASIARAMVTGPKLLLMDEPFAALDEFTRAKLNDDLLALWQQNRWTVIFVTHSIREAVFLAERVLVMSPRPGRVIADRAISLAGHRDDALRLSHAFTDQCADISRLLAEAIQPPVNP